MKKIIIIVSAIVMLLVTSACSAMTISQPTCIGTAIGVNIGGFWFKNEISNLSQGPLTRKKAHTKGIATFGDNNKKLYLHYKTYGYDYNTSPQVSRYGSASSENAIQIDTLDNTIYMLKTNENITLYIIYSDYDIAGDDNFTIIGERADGRFVKYLVTDTIFENYYGERDVRRSYFVDDFIVRGDTIVFYYSRSDIANVRPVPRLGEIRCKWDESAQWFSVENVVY